MEMMDKHQNLILDETEAFESSMAVTPLSYHLQKEGKPFAVTLDTKGFFPLVRQVGRNLGVSSKTEEMQEDQKDCCTYRCHEFRQEFDLPEGVNPQDVTCYLAPDGKLHIQQAESPRVQGAERELTIKSWEEETQQSV